MTERKSTRKPAPTGKVSDNKTGDPLAPRTREEVTSGSLPGWLPADQLDGESYALVQAKANWTIEGCLGRFSDPDAAVAELIRAQWLLERNMNRRIERKLGGAFIATVDTRTFELGLKVHRHLAILPCRDGEFAGEALIRVSVLRSGTTFADGQVRARDGWGERYKTVRVPGVPEENQGLAA